MAENHDTEITLGTGRMLALFFGFVFVCAVFFALGYSVGRSSTPAGPVVSETLAVPAANAATTPKPSAAKPEDAPPSSSDELTFYKSVEQAEPNPQLTKTAPPETAAAPPDLVRPRGGYVVQVAAVTKRDDAEALMGALRKKQYPVFVTNESAADRLFRVQVGPFGDMGAADAMKARLVEDGYNPIVKK